jgi:hypothetical protein
MLRGETLLRMKQPRLAQDAFSSAARVTRRDAQMADTAAARGMALLIAASPGMQYAPKDRSEPIDIVDPASRKQALAALYHDRLAAVQPKYDAAMKGSSLAPMVDLLPALSDLYALECAATGTSEHALPMGQAMGARARDLINAELARLGDAVARLEDQANEPTGSGPGGRWYSRRGLTSIEQGQLKDDAQYLDKIRQVAQQGRLLNRRFGGTGEIWDGIISESTDLRDRAAAAYERK